MPSQVLTDIPTPLAGLEAGTSYSIQNLTRGRNVFIQRSSAVPPDADGAQELFPWGHILSVGTVSKGSGEEIYAWVQGDAGRVSYDEAG